jgi:16S rRNA (uracil1498-N3)-methyltransferase
MSRFYISKIITGGTVAITDAGQLHHLRNVLRLNIGEEIIVFDMGGVEYLCVINGLDKKQAVLTIKNRKPRPPKNMMIAIACAVPKKARFDDIIDKLTQLGVDTIIPLDTDRSVVKLEENPEARLERWQRIARNASEQSRRNTLPVVTRVLNVAGVLDYAADYDLKLISTLAGEVKPISCVMAGSKPEKILVLIGPEGDFTHDEVDLAVKADFIPVSLGDAVLRVETAAIAIAGYLRLSFK